MKVLLQSRADLYDKPGGDLVQMQQTQKALQKIGVDVDISNDVDLRLDQYDLIHLFNITRVHETYAQLLNAKKQKKKVVVSPIHHKLAEIQRYEREGRTGNLRYINTFLPSISLREQAKMLLRSRDGRQRGAIKSTLAKGFVAAQKYVLEHSDAWVVLAEMEAQQIISDFNVNNRYFIAHNGVDPQFFTAKRDQFIEKYNMQDFILCVSRIEDRKNQIRLIEACRGLGKKLVFIGGENKNHGPYVAAFKNLIESNSEWVTYLGQIPYESLPSAYKAASMHVLPSWFEVVGLTALEAAAVGCKGVVSNTGNIKEYLGDSVVYCDPGNVQSIRDGIVAVLEAKSPTKPKIQTWDTTGEETLAAYKRVLNNAEE